MGIIHLETFIIAVIIFAITPGVDTLYVLNRTLTQGKKAGIYSTLGILSGVLVHITLAAFGLSVILAESALAFTIVKYAGAAYLVYLGVSKLLSKEQPNGVSTVAVKANSTLKIYTSGVITNVFNPKVALFFLAFFPQFIDPSKTGSPLPFLFLGAVYIVIDLIWCVLLTLGASLFAKRIMGSMSFGKWLNKISGFIFILLGIKIALSKS